MTATTANARSWTDHWSFNGVPINKIKENPAELIKGIAIGVIGHTVGHYVVGAFVGVNMHQNGSNIFEEIWSKTPSNYDEAMIGRAGFINQLLVRAIAKRSGASDSFILGIDIMNHTEITSYKAIFGNSGDVWNINRSGNVDTELLIYSKIAEFNLISHQK